MKRKLILPIYMLISLIGVTTLGFFMIFNPLHVEIFIKNIIQVIIIGMGILSIIPYMFNRKEENIRSVIAGILYITLGIFIEYKIKFIQASLIIIVGIYALINFTVQLISTIIYYKDKTKMWRVSAITTSISLIFGIILTFHPLKYKILLYKIAGIYLILYGISIFKDFIIEILKKDNVKRRIRIRLPLIYTAFLPQRLLEKINGSLKVDSKQVFIDSKSDNEGELEIFIHLSKEMASGFGHVDICFGDKIYSYGTYDSSSNRLFKLVSDGVLIEANRDKYIEFATKKSHLVSFVVSLNTSQCKTIEDKINSIKKKCIRWYCKSELDDTNEYTDHANCMYLDTNCEFYKFKSGYFKTYFVFTTNCVKLADAIICSAGIGGLTINGIITPGVYFKFFDDLFKIDNSIVIRRNVYRQIS